MNKVPNYRNDDKEWNNWSRKVSTLVPLSSVQHSHVTMMTQTNDLQRISGIVEEKAKRVFERLKGIDCVVP
jgi:hypothetical protein